MPRVRKRAPKAANHAGSVTFDKAKRRWRVAVSQPDGSRVYRSAPTQDAAIALRNELLGHAAQGVPVGRNDALGGVLVTWRDTVLPAKQLAPATVNQYRWALRTLDAGLGKVKVRTLTVERVEHFLGQRATAGLSRNSVRVLRSVLVLVLDEQVRRRHVAHNVAKLALLPHDARPVAQRRALTAEEVARLLQAAQGHQLEALVILALATGARRGELLALEWSDIDEKAGTVSITKGLRKAQRGGYEIGSPKTAKSARVVALPTAARSALRAHRKAQRAAQMAAPRWEDTGLIFTNSTGAHADPARLRRQWVTLVKEAGLPEDVTFHFLRHTVGSHAVDDGYALTEVADQLGHASVDMLARTYRHKIAPVVDVTAATGRLLAPPRTRR